MIGLPETWWEGKSVLEPGLAKLRAHTHGVGQLLTRTHLTGCRRKASAVSPASNTAAPTSPIAPLTQPHTNKALPIMSVKASKCQLTSSLTKVLIPSDALSGQVTKYERRLSQARECVCRCVGQGRRRGSCASPVITTPSHHMLRRSQ